MWSSRVMEKRQWEVHEVEIKKKQNTKKQPHPDNEVLEGQKHPQTPKECLSRSLAVDSTCTHRWQENATGSLIRVCNSLKRGGFKLREGAENCASVAPPPPILCQGLLHINKSMWTLTWAQDVNQANWNWAYVAPREPDWKQDKGFNQQWVSPA